MYPPTISTSNQVSRRISNPTVPPPVVTPPKPRQLPNKPVEQVYDYDEDDDIFGDSSSSYGGGINMELPILEPIRDMQYIMETPQELKECVRFIIPPKEYGAA